MGRLFLDLFYMCECFTWVCIYMNPVSAWVLWASEKASNSLEPEIKMLLNHHMGAGN